MRGAGELPLALFFIVAFEIIMLKSKADLAENLFVFSKLFVSLLGTGWKYKPPIRHKPHKLYHRKLMKKYLLTAILAMVSGKTYTIVSGTSSTTATARTTGGSSGPGGR